MNILIDLAYLLTAVVISPVAIYRMLRHGRYRAGWANRFGHIERKRPDKRCIWIHAVSVGEVNATTTIIRELENKFSDYEIVISTTTDTGYARANALFGSRLCVFYFPMDFSQTMRRAFANIRPAICLLIELEVWPNLVRIAHQSGVPVVVVNGRLSDRSFSRYKLIQPITKKIFQDITLVLAQTEEYAERFREIGVPAGKVVVTGSVKYDTAQVADKVEGADVLATQLGLKNERLWVAGATGDGEEQIILDVYRQLIEQKQFADLRLTIVPRKPERFEEVANLIKQAGFELIRYSEVKKKATENYLATESTPRPTDCRGRKDTLLRPQGYAGQAESTEKSIIKVILGDTMGDLRKFYSLATVIFVGRSLVPMGGSDMMEAAALGKCTIFGPHAFNFKQAVDDLLKADGAILVKDASELFNAMTKCLADVDYARRIARNGQEIIRKNQGATARTIAQITKLLREG
ncbi:MAG: 3-deoxy-D-manno-octulosonic acid transferase [Sedimentisphaerales bacterium]|nr:3-deoxy-D-manno-octulosonic acid transferase [Sedimentisphaerales bacterium]